MSGVKGKSGGPRPNSGRPKQIKTVSEKTKKAILKAAKELADEYGEPIEKAMLRLCYEKDVQDTVKASVWKSYLESLVAKETKQDVNLDRPEGPGILLPPIRKKDPALAVMKNRENV